MEDTAMDRLRWVLTLIVIGAAGFALVWWWRAAPVPDATVLLPAPGPQSTMVPSGHGTPVLPEIAVDVVGAVQRPGLYYLGEGARVDDAITAAGGLTPDANRDAINLAARLKDEQQLRVPHVGDAPVARNMEPTVPTPVIARLDLNTADIVALETLPGIGSEMARRIVDYRTAHGPFRNVDQLDEISGIGAETLAELRNLVTVEP
jgi:competence protein ComEA